MVAASAAADRHARTFRERLNAFVVQVPTPDPPVTCFDEGSVSVDGLPPSAGRPMLALAQHFGLSTTMLDWTRRGWVAAYFAAADAAATMRRPACRRRAGQPSCLGHAPTGSHSRR